MPVSVGVMDSTSARHKDRDRAGRPGSRKGLELCIHFMLSVQPRQANSQSPFLKTTGELCSYTCEIKDLLSYDSKYNDTVSASLVLFLVLSDFPYLY